MIILEITTIDPLQVMGLVDLDVTFLFELGAFLFLMITMQHLFFKPLLRNLDHRRDAIIGAREVAEELTLEAETLVVQRRDAIETARDTAHSLVTSMKAEGVIREKEVVSEAQRVVEAQIGDGRREIQRAVAASRQETDKEAEQLATTLVNHLLQKA